MLSDTHGLEHVCNVVGASETKQQRRRSDLMTSLKLDGSFSARSVVFKKKKKKKSSSDLYLLCVCVQSLCATEMLLKP